MKLASYILVCAFVFAWIDWRVIYLTRFTHPEWKEWMHSKEWLYSLVVRPVEYILCTPALAIKEHFYLALISLEATTDEEKAITHFDYSGNPLLPDGANFWRIVRTREDGWKKISFAAHYLLWIPKCLIWYWFWVWLAVPILERILL